MNEWKEITLGEISAITKLAGYEFTKHIKYNSDGEIIALRALNLRNGVLDLTDIKRIDKNISNLLPRSKLFVNDILLTYTGNGYGDTAIIRDNDKFHLAPNICKITCNEDVDCNFVFHYIKWKQFRKQMSNFITGSSQPTIPMKTIRMLKIQLPPLETQQKTAKILSCLDEKIKLNNKINANLEEQARTVVNNWEINNTININMSKIQDVTEINTINYSIKENWEFVNYLDTSNITNNQLSEIQYIDVSNEKLPSRAKRKVMKNDILFSTVRPNQLHFGIINNPLENMLVSTGFAVIRSKSPNLNNEFLYIQLTKNEVVDKLHQIGEQSTSTYPAIKPIDIANLIIPIPNEDDKKMLDYLKSTFKIISSTQQENENLIQLRDTLLPKLMSGEIDVDKVVV